MLDDPVLWRKSISSDLAVQEGLKNLLCAASPDSEHELDRGPVDPGVGKSLDLLDGFFEAIVPKRFVWHAELVEEGS